MPIAKGLLELGDTTTIDAPFSKLQHQLYLEAQMPASVSVCNSVYEPTDQFRATLGQNSCMHLR